jgi:hypothetical protein
LLEKNGVVKESNFWCCEFVRPKNGFLKREKKLTNLIFYRNLNDYFVSFEKKN